MEQTSTLTVIRRRALTAAVRKFRILCDGVEVAKIANNSTVTLTLPPGRHSVQVKFDWLGAKPIEITLLPDQDHQFVCGSADDFGQSLLASLCLQNTYLQLRPVDEHQPLDVTRRPNWGRGALYCASWFGVVAILSAIAVTFIISEHLPENVEEARTQAAGLVAGMLLGIGWCVILLRTYTKA
ncbi:MAG: hypothetical protein JSS49_28110 [Planctomycetes bacterium]|nr:hypothetical protein [Planctomycetota bacterium]